MSVSEEKGALNALRHHSSHSDIKRFMKHRSVTDHTADPDLAVGALA